MGELKNKFKEFFQNIQENNNNKQHSCFQKTKTTKTTKD